MKKDNALSTLEYEKIRKRRKLFSIISIIFFLLFSLFVFWFIGRKMIAFVGKPEKFRLWVDEIGIKSRFIFIGMVTFQLIFAIIPGEPLEIGAGYAFGIIEGTLLCMIGSLIGSILVFLFSRYCGRKAVEAIYPPEKLNRFTFLNNPEKLNTLTFILFLIPGTPKDVMTYFIGLTSMKLKTWILISTIARIPSIITSTIGGSALGEKNYVFAIIAFGVTILISISGMLLHKKISQKHQ